MCLVSIIRLQSLVRISNSPDPTFDNPPAATFSVVEANVGIICACLPYMRPLLSAVCPKYFPEIVSRSVRLDDEERGKLSRTPSSSSQPRTPRKGSMISHSRSSSKSSISAGRVLSNISGYTYESDMEDMVKHEATVTSTATFVKGHVRKVTIGSSVGSERMLPFTPNPLILPRLPENLATIGPLEQAGRTRYSRTLPNPRPLHKYRPETPLDTKPLPVTPFPVASPPRY